MADIKKALVCGAGGFIGSHMVRRLRSEGYWVRGVDQKYPEFSQTEAHPKCHHDTEEGDTDRVSVLEARLDKLVNTLKKHYGDID